MSSLLNIRLPKPKDWQDFERKSRELFALVLADPKTRMHGRTGQPQHGVDIWGHRNEDLSRLVGVQCKLSNNEITAAELETELDKAKSFVPAISEFFLVTTSARDAKIQQIARELTKSLSGTIQPIRVEIWSWDDIEESAANYADAWKIFDPTFNPFAEQTRDEVRVGFHTLDGRLDSIDAKIDSTRRPPLPERAPPFILPYHETPSFTGREEELAALESALLNDRDNRVCSIAGLSGTGGIGKSALAVHFATVHRAQFPGGVIGLRVDGKNSDTIAREFAREVGEIIDADDERAASSIMQSVFGDRKILLIFDNAEQTNLRDLIPGGRSCTIVTTRDRGLPIALEVPESARIDVPELDEARGVELLRKRLASRVDAEIDESKQIVRLVGGLPLALQIIASVLEVAAWRTLASLVAVLSDEREKLLTLEFRDDPHLNVRVSFNASLKFLREDEVDFLACLSICDTDSFAVRSAAAAGGCKESIAIDRLGYLYRISLVNRPVDAKSVRFVLHPLLRSFAGELADKRGITPPASERHARYFIDLTKSISPRDADASRAIVEDVGEALSAARWLLNQNDVDYTFIVSLLPAVVQSGHWGEMLELLPAFLAIARTREDVYAAIQFQIQQSKFLQLQGDFDGALDILQSLLKEPHDDSPGSNRIQAMVLNSLGGVLQRLGKFQEAAEALTRSSEIEERQSNERGQAMVLNSLGGVLQRLGKFQEAFDALKRSHDLLVLQGDERGQAMVLNSLGGVLQRLGKFQEAADAFLKASEIEQRLGNERGQAMVLNSLGGVLQRLGKFQEAADAFIKATEIEDRIGNERGQAMVLNSLGGVLQRLGKFQEAADALERSKAISEQMGDDRGLAMVLNSLGGVLQRLGKFQEAADALGRSVAVAEVQDDPASVAMRLNSLGGVLQRLGKFQEAADALGRSIAVAEVQDDPPSVAMRLNSLGGVLQRLGKFQEAADALERSKAISEQMGDERSLAMVLNSLGGVLQRLGKFQEATDALERSKVISEQMGDERSLAMVLNSLGGVLQRLGKFQEAADALERSKAISEQMGDDRGLAMILNSLGGALQRLGRHQEADRAFTQSISLGLKLNDRMHLAKVRTGFGKALVTRGEIAAGLEQLRQGFALDEDKKNRKGMAIVAPLLINTLRQRGRHEEADEYLKRAITLAPNERSIERLVLGHTSQSLPTASTRLTGKIKRLLQPLGRPRYGFLTSDLDGADIYFSERQIGADVFSALSLDLPVEADIILTSDGRRQAQAIRTRI